MIGSLVAHRWHFYAIVLVKQILGTLDAVQISATPVFDIASIAYVANILASGALDDPALRVEVLLLAAMGGVLEGEPNFGRWGRIHFANATLGDPVIFPGDALSRRLV
jgi:hypothetical protein